MNPSDPSAPVKVAAVQMVSAPDVASNLEAADALVAQAANEGAGVVLLPEYFCLMGRHDTDKVGVREADGRGPIQDFLADAARRHGVWLIGGTLPLECPNPSQVYNTTLVFDPRGERRARYDKIHLFGFQRGDEAYDESATILAGREPVAFEAPCGRVGLSVCYDLRFPELYRALGTLDLIVVPAAFTYTTGQAHWEILLRARAIENQCYVLASAQGGKHPNGRRTWGHSMLIDPWGDILAVRAEGPDVVCGEIDPGRLKEVRAALPALRHRVF
ncbi:MAG: carbon-nitrogen hydrolase family protein [Pigmentiphaga sp.]